MFRKQSLLLVIAAGAIEYIYNIVYTYNIQTPDSALSPSPLPFHSTGCRFVARPAYFHTLSHVKWKDSLHIWDRYQNELDLTVKLPFFLFFPLQNELATAKPVDADDTGIPRDSNVVILLAHKPCVKWEPHRDKPTKHSFWTLQSFSNNKFTIFFSGNALLFIFYF